MTTDQASIELDTPRRYAVRYEVFNDGDWEIVTDTIEADRVLPVGMSVCWHNTTTGASLVVSDEQLIASWTEEVSSRD
ncbi:uncharacterized protein ChaoS9_060 [Halobacterium phage ChaoS9]|uniref:Uncharacterized protein n=1 Tax=Halobacterium phage ChaoS9 TaxID=2847105 RepID=A0A481V8D8_9CAUD|nr:uncharacterized protein KMC41_gp13 [Halobacterium phage ChaoS9]QBI90019.1 uncharacterized protein ChaoS9_060 [Halobacterium phage ChaoS9]